MEFARGNKIIDESSITADAYSNVIKPGSKNGFVMTYNWNSSGNLVASLYLQCRNNKQESWRTVNNADFPSSPDGSSGSDEYAVVDCSHSEYRVFVDFTSGDGELEMYVNFK